MKLFYHIYSIFRICFLRASKGLQSILILQLKTSIGVCLREIKAHRSNFLQLYVLCLLVSKYSYQLYVRISHDWEEECGFVNYIHIRMIRKSQLKCNTSKMVLFISHPKYVLPLSSLTPFFWSLPPYSPKGEDGVSIPSSLPKTKSLLLPLNERISVRLIAITLVKI